MSFRGRSRKDQRSLGILSPGNRQRLPSTLKFKTFHHIGLELHERGMTTFACFQERMNTPVYASSCPALQSNLSLHSSSYYNEYGGAARRRLSSTGEADTSATSSYEGSDSSENSDESRLEPVSQMEREQLETFFRGLKSQVSRNFRISLTFLPVPSNALLTLVHDRYSSASRWRTCTTGTRRKPRPGTFDSLGYRSSCWTSGKRGLDPRGGFKYCSRSAALASPCGERPSIICHRIR